MNGHDQPVLRTENLRKAFGDKVVLRHVDLDIGEHEVVCLIGASGSGKSTLLRCINRLVEYPDEGTIELDGVDIPDSRGDVGDELSSQMGIVFQSYNLFPHLSVLDNITLAPRKVHDRDTAKAKAEAHELLGLFDMGESSPTRTPIGSRAASSSGSRWPGRWQRTRRCCCSTR